MRISALAFGVVIVCVFLVDELHDNIGGKLFNFKSRPVVEGLPPGYDRYVPRQPYSGPLPAEVPFRPDASQYPVALGSVGPIDYSLGPPQYPFACDTEVSGLGQPIIDNQDGAGIAVRDDKGKVIGYSKDCQVGARAEYYYAAQGMDVFLPLPPGEFPADMEWIDINGKTIPFVIRVERGTINRFIYGIAVLQNPSLPVGTADGQLWNQRLIYYFRGGVSIGKVQGKVNVNTLTLRRKADLADGYAVIFSGGTRTTNHYDVVRASHTAAMVKQQFIARYGKPDFTIGVGESGGGIQQYMAAQNQPGLLDGLIPIYSYPDMITQTIWVLDCDLLEYYFDVTAADQPRWRKQEERSLVEGVAADSSYDDKYLVLNKWLRRLSFRSALPPGATACVIGWRLLNAMTNNPRFYHRFRRFAPEIREGERFSHWHDLKRVYGIDESGYARRTWDNVGVQYGLQALRSGAISPAEFFHLNANIGSWKDPKDMQDERLWLLSDSWRFWQFNLWSEQNIQKPSGGPTPLAVFESGEVKAVRVAPRRHGDLDAIAAAYRSGQVFLGDIDVPVIDVRHYLDDQLNMHHSFESLATRLRLQNRRGSSDNMVIWVADPAFNPFQLARETLAEWLAKGRPPAAVDACFDLDGDTIAKGASVWDGDWNGKPEGACVARYPYYRTPRNVSGAPLAGDLFRCALVSVEEAISRGFYNPVEMEPNRTMLEKIFPDGVCDYAKGDLGRPANFPNAQSIKSAVTVD